ncbi:hypothetical protein AL523_17805 [Enterococcus gallinarum]|nr:hypothetical protein AL523_17805 [Enterococcus gallinarum]
MRNICNRISVFEAIAERGYCFFVFGTKSLKNAFDISSFYSLFYALLLVFTQLLMRKVRMKIKKAGILQQC